MKALVWLGATASVAIVVATGGAMAADLAPIYDTPIYQEVPEVQSVEIGTGWYLRGDVGYQFKSDLRSSFDVNLSGVNQATGGYDGLEMPQSATFSAGIGYKFNEFIRADATAAYWKGDLNDANFPGAGVSVDSDTTAYELMANAYVDLGTFAGFTPYVGAGAGAVHLEYDTNCSFGGSACSATFDQLDVDNGSDWRFAYSLMAGVSYDVSQNLKLDVGYRFTDVDGGGNTTITGLDTSTGDTIGITSSDDGFKRHTIQAGLRYSLW